MFPCWNPSSDFPFPTKCLYCVHHALHGFFLPIFVAESHNNSLLPFYFFQQQISCISSHPVLFAISSELLLTFLFFSYHLIHPSRNSYQIYLKNLSGNLPLYSFFPAIRLFQKVTLTQIIVIALLPPLFPEAYSPPISHWHIFKCQSYHIFYPIFSHLP